MESKFTDNYLIRIVKIGNNIPFPKVYTAEPQSFPGRMFTRAMNNAVVCKGFKKCKGIVDKPLCCFGQPFSFYIQGNPRNFLNSGFENSYFSFAHLSIIL